MQKFKQFAGFLAAVLTVGSSAFAAEYFIPDGTTKDFSDQLSAALDGAVDGDIITIRKGEYTVTKTLGWTSYMAVKKSGLTLRGDPSDGPDNVIIHGGPSYFGVRTTDDSYKLDVQNLTFDGFTYCQGKSANTAGSAIYGSNICVSNCVIRNCACKQGGNVYLATMYDCILSNNTADVYGCGAGDCSAYRCRFVDNTAPRGGALFNGHKVDHCVFVNNHATDSYAGGAARQQKCAVPAAYTYCYFTNNTGRYAGAIYSDDSQTDVATNCVFYGNRALGTGNTHLGGAVYGVDLYKCELINNFSTYGAGAAYLGVAEYCKFCCNTVGTDTVEGAAGGAVSTMALYECEFYNNSSSGKGGAVVDASIVSNCVFVGNHVRSSTRDGGALNNSITTRVIGCAFTNNVAARYGGALYSGILEKCSFGFNVASGKAGYCVYDAVCMTDCVFDGENIDDYADSTMSGNGIVYSGSVNKPVIATNCVFKNYNIYHIIRGGSNSGINIELVNCLFHSNKMGYTLCRVDSGNLRLRNCTIADNVLPDDGVARVAGDIFCDNSIFYNNVSKNDGKRTDVKFYGGKVADGSHNCYGVLAEGLSVPFAGEDNFQVSAVKFVGAGEHPYQLAYKQKDARIKTGGAVGDWTADDKDLAGNPRLHGEGTAATIGLGCYECWTMPKGLMLLLR